MIKKNFYIKIGMCGIAAGCILLTSISGAHAYFTSHASAAGQKMLILGPTTTEIEEGNPSDFKKHIIVHNTGEFDCYIRVTLFAGDFVKIGKFSGDNWYRKGGYYVYDEVVSAGGQTSQLDVSFEILEGQKDNFNIIVVQESSQVCYDLETGLPYADWNQKISTDISFDSKESGEE